MSAESREIPRPAHRVTEDISAPASHVWSLLSDVVAWPYWLPTVTSVTPLGAGRLEVGARFRLRQPRLLPATWKVTSVDAGRRFVWEAASPGVAMWASHVIEPTGAGTCRLTLELAFSGALSPLIGLLVGSLTRQYIRTEAASLKARAEAAASPGSPPSHFSPKAKASVTVIDYRLNVPLDAREVARVFDDSGLVRPTGDLDRIARMLAASNLVWSAWSDGALVGVCRALTDHSYCCYLSDLAVVKALQHQGVGRQLIQRVRDTIGEEVTLVLVSSQDAVDFYPKAGFAKADTAYIIRRSK